ncbi:MAG: histidine kinase [Ornithinimicrobium sp.]
MVGSALLALWEEPQAAAPPGTAWWDRALVAGLVPVTVLEVGLRGDVAWPIWHATWALVCVATLLWRRHRPLAMLILAYGAQTVAGVIPALAGEPHSVLDVTAVVLLLAYSLGRWASGKGVVVGSLFLLAMHLAREPLYDSSGSSIVIGVGALMLPVALGALVRSWAVSQLRARELIRVREREQLARDLHDTVAHHVSGILMHARAAKVRGRTEPGAAAEAIDGVEEAAAHTLDDMRAMVAVLRGTEEAVKSRFPTHHVTDIPLLACDHGPGPRVVVQTSGDIQRLPPPVGSALFRAAQEAVTNARQHAVEPTLVAVQVTDDGDCVRLRVHDDGRPASAARRRRARPSYGLAGMRERFSLLGGDVRAGPDLDGGWTVEATVPKGAQGQGHGR